MLGPTHACIALGLLRLLGLIDINSYGTIALSIFFSLLPDIDQPSGLLSWIFRTISKWLYVYFGHRNITHSLLFLALASSPLLPWPSLYITALASIGVHLLSDMLTYTGVPLLWPYKKNFVIFGGPLITGKWFVEGTISGLALALFIFLP